MAASVKADLKSKVISSLIQGVSQQAAQARRDSQCEEQFDCTNSAADGVVPRPHFEYVSQIAQADLTGAFCYEIIRGATEHYLAVIKGGDLKVYNLNDGSLCTLTVTAPDGLAYLSHSAGDDRLGYCGQTIDDFHFIASKSVLPAMKGTLSPVPPKEAMVFFKAGGYSLTYTITITTADGTGHTWAYTTPDNSTVNNGNYIGTDQLAKTFFAAMTTSPYLAPSGYTYGDNNTSGTPTVKAGQSFPETITSLGFQIDIIGNLLRFRRGDGVDFAIDVSDGAGGNNLKCFKDVVQDFTDLPEGGFQDFTLKVIGTDKSAADDYYVKCAGSGFASQSWGEVVAPGTQYQLEPTTMPYALVNTGVNTFEWRQNVWGDRVAGDGILTAKNPYFIGKPIQALAFYQDRLSIMTDGADEWSKSGNEFVWFPDTVQTELATAPISIRITASGGQRNQSVSLLRQSIEVAEELYLWAQRAQFRIDSGQDPFKEGSVEAHQSTVYEFSEACNLLPLGPSSVYFATSRGNYSTIRTLTYYLGKPQGDTDITAHIPSYVPANLTDLTASDTLSTLFARSDNTPSNLYCWNFLISGSDIAQSAWNTWRLPVDNIIWVSVYQQYVMILAQRAATVFLLRADLTRGLTDPGFTDYTTRLDLRINEAQCVVAYNTDTELTTVRLPFTIPGATLVIRQSDANNFRGQQIPVTVSGDTLLVPMDLTGSLFYVGNTYAAERTESRFFLRSDNGAQPTDKLTVRFFRVTHANSAYYRVEVTGDTANVQEFNSRELGYATGNFGPPQIATGSFKIEVGAESGQYKLRLINDSYLPSAWIAGEYQYEAAIRATPSP